MTTDSHAAAEFARHFPKIAGSLSAEQLGILLNGATMQEIAAGRTLIRDRMPVDCLYFLLDGEFGVYIEIEGKAKRIATAHPGEWLGEVSVLSGEFKASATVIADTDGRVMRIHHKSFESLIAQNEAIAKVLLDQFIELMAARLRGYA